jgi:methyl-accepting chemotaxis protein
MPFTLHFDSRNNTEILDIYDLEELAIAKCIGANKYNNIVFDKHFNQPIPKLPTFIKNLTFGHNFNQDISNIGDHIESIIFEVSDFNYNLATFPKGLRELKIISDKISSRIENINPGLENLTIQSMTFNDEIKLANTNIKSVKIQSYSFNRSLQELPPGLKSLVINSILFTPLHI